MDDFGAQVVAAQDGLRRWALRLCKDVVWAEDLVQWTMLRAIKKRSQFKPGSNMGAWLGTILRNRFIGELRTQDRIITDTDDMFTRNMPSADDMEASLYAKQCLSFLIHLQADQLRVLLLLAEGATYDEIAEMEGVPAGTVKSRASRGRRRLAELIEARP